MSATTEKYTEEQYLEADHYQPKTSTGRIANYVDTRVGGTGIVREFGRKVFPDTGPSCSARSRSTASSS